MESTKDRHSQKILSLIGCMFILMPSGKDLYWGGISVYALSFIATRINSDSQLEAPITLSLLFITWTFAVILSDPLCKCIGTYWVILFGIVLSNVAVYLSYFAIQKSFLFFNVMFAGFGGLGTGITYGTAMHIVAQNSGKNVGLFTSVLLTSPSIGAIMIIQLVTWYTNPENKVPTWKIKSTAYFTQKDVVDRVPSMCLVLGGVMTAMNIVGLIILFFGTATISSKNCIKEITETYISKFRDCDEVEKEEECSRGTNISSSDVSASNMSPNEVKDYTPKEMLKTTTFYALYFSFPITELSLILVINYYKLFSQIFIKDDHFLSTGGTISIFTAVVLRAIKGLALDKFGARNCLLVFLSCLTFAMSWFYFAAMAGPWVYLFATIFYFSVAGVAHTSFYVAIALLFGKTHVASNLGILLSSSIALNLAGPIIIETIITNYGWFALFACASGLQIGSIVLCLLFVQ